MGQRRISFVVARAIVDRDVLAVNIAATLFEA